ncbi:MAG: dCTP deaminase [Deltaproteobacteria bacterium]|nr:dCTP deaminase [Deltaproteobacteria bacterium]
MLKNDMWITFKSDNDGMIVPFVGHQVREKLMEVQEVPGGIEESRLRPVISYGLTSYGYDMRVARNFKLFTNINSTFVDPKDPSTQHFEDFEDVDSILIPPSSYALAHSLEHFKIPRDVLGICLGKSTYARCGLAVNITPLEPEWEGYLTIEIANCTPLPVRVYAEEGIAQLIFLGADSPCNISYADKKGKYQDQPKEVVPAKV